MDCTNSFSQIEQFNWNQLSNFPTLAMIPMCNIARDKVLALGFEDYIVTPLHPQEITLRLKTVVVLHKERVASQQQSIYSSNFVGASPVNPHQTLAQQTCELLLQSFQQEWTLPMLSSELGTNRNKLSQVFKAQTGMTVFEWLRTQKMQYARKLVRGSFQSIQAIASQVGIDDAGNFSNAYRNNFGISPSQDRKMAQVQQAVTEAQS